MKTTRFFAFLATIALATNAHALKVSNLDTVPHTVIYETAGTVSERVVPPNRTVHFHGYPDGRLSLKPAGKVVKRPSGGIHADGLLSGVIGASRSSDIPASSNYDFVIWPGGQLRIQHHRQHNIF